MISIQKEVNKSSALKYWCFLILGIIFLLLTLAWLAQMYIIILKLEFACLLLSPKE